MKLLREALAKEGINDISEIHGGASDAVKQKGINDFQAGKNRVAIATAESGGTGINLNDEKGDAPRSIHIMTAPWSATENTQAIGRGHRLTSKSDTDVHYHFAKTPVDAWNKGLIAGKMSTLGAVVGGETSHLMPGHEEKGTSTPFQWRNLVRGESPVVAQPAAKVSTASPVTSSPTIPTRQVSTKMGQRHVHSFEPSSKFWNERKAGNLPSDVSVGKNPKSGAWEASIWGKSAEEVAQHAKALASKGIHGAHFSRGGASFPADSGFALLLSR